MTSIGFSDPGYRAALREPFPPEQIGKLPATAKRPELDYVGHAAVTDRLNQAAPDWTYDITPVVVVGSIESTPNGRTFVPHPDGVPHVVGVFGRMTIGGVTRQEVGEVDAFTTYGDELKKAISDFIRRGAMRFGVALDLWSKEDLNLPSSDATTQGDGTPAADVFGEGATAAGTTSSSSKATAGPQGSGTGRRSRVPRDHEPVEPALPDEGTTSAAPAKSVGAPSRTRDRKSRPADAADGGRASRGPVETGTSDPPGSKGPCLHIHGTRTIARSTTGGSVEVCVDCGLALEVTR